jgi:hypothetical protein
VIAVSNIPEANPKTIIIIPCSLLFTVDCPKGNQHGVHYVDFLKGNQHSVNKENDKRCKYQNHGSASTLLNNNDHLHHCDRQARQRAANRIAIPAISGGVSNTSRRAIRTSDRRGLGAIQKG